MATITAPAVFVSGTLNARTLSTAMLLETKPAVGGGQPLRKAYRAYNTPALQLGLVWRKEALFALSPEFPYGTTDTSGHYAAVVKQNNVVLANCRVAIYWRDTMQLIAKAVTNANGEFRFDGLIPDINRYFAIALDPDGGVLQNALIYDRLTPIK